MADPDDDEPEAPSLTIEAPTVNAADPVEQRRRATRAELEDREAKEFWRTVFASEIGRREMWKLLEFHHPFSTQHRVAPNGFPAEMASLMALGEQQLGVRIYRWWQTIDRDGVMRMELENAADMQPPKRRRGKKSDAV